MNWISTRVGFEPGFGTHPTLTSNDSTFYGNFTLHIKNFPY
jgi:hypothetical protein